MDFLANLGAFRWENPNPDSCFYFKAANSLLKQKRSTSCKIEEKIADLVPLSSDKKITTKTGNSSNLKHGGSNLQVAGRVLFNCVDCMQIAIEPTTAFHNFMTIRRRAGHRREFYTRKKELKQCYCVNSLEQKQRDIL